MDAKSLCAAAWARGVKHLAAVRTTKIGKEIEICDVAPTAKWAPFYVLRGMAVLSTYPSLMELRCGFLFCGHPVGIGSVYTPEESTLAASRAKSEEVWGVFWRQVRWRKRFAFFVSTKPR
jgi:hypothetical protein